MNKFLFFVFVLAQYSIFAQVDIDGDFPEDGMFVTEQLHNVTLLNSGQERVEGKLVVTIQKNGTEKVLEMSTFPFFIEVGVPKNGIELNWNSQIEYGSNRASEGLRHSGILPVGKYIFCYSFFGTNASGPFKSCQEVRIEGMSPPELMSPSDKEFISSLPILSWMAPVLSSPIEGIKYHLKLVELKSGQSADIAVKQNFPLMEVQSTRETQMMFTSERNLEEGKTYAWQVNAFLDDFDLGQTEIWMFSYGKEIFEIEEPMIESYRMVKRERNSGLYSANSKLYFGYDNKLSEQNLNYSLVSMNRNKVKIFTDLPKINLDNGLNQLVLDCEKLGLKDEQKYSIEIVDPKGVKYFLDFKYFSNKKK